MKYGSSCFLQLFDDKPPPPPLEIHFDQVKRERVARDAAKKKFQDDLAAKVVHVKHDHCYTHARSGANDTEEEESVVLPHLTNVLYRNHVVLNLEQRKDLEVATTLQSDSELWFNARKL